MRRPERRGHWLAAAALAALPAAAALAQENQASGTAKNNPQATVRINTIEENAANYRGKTVTVEGEVDEVLGPRMFKVDEQAWLDFDGETLVFVPAPLAVVVREGEPVTVTGTLRTIADVELDGEWGWFPLEPEAQAQVNRRNVIVATAIRSEAGPDVTSRLLDPAQPAPGAALTDVAMLARSETGKLVGRRVNLSDVRVVSIAKDGGFWLNAGGDTLFVLPARADAWKLYPGDTVSVSGTVLSMPEAMKARVSDRKIGSDEAIYVYASELKRTR